MSRQPDTPASDRASPSQPVPKTRPLERFWPYADLSEHHSPDELAALDPELYAALFGARPRPFSFTLVFPKFEADDYEAALALARSAPEYRETGSGEAFRHRARFYPRQALQLRELYQIVGRFDACEVLVDDQPVPYARELWLPLLWMLIERGAPPAEAEPVPND